jgi:hypothetical protein
MMEVEGLLPPGASPPLRLQTAAAVGAAAAHATHETAEGSSSRTTQELTPSLTQTGDSDVDGGHSAAPATAQPGVGAASAPSAVTEASRTIGALEKEADEGNLDDLEALQDAFAAGDFSGILPALDRIGGARLEGPQIHPHPPKCATIAFY